MDRGAGAARSGAWLGWGSGLDWSRALESTRRPKFVVSDRSESLVSAASQGDRGAVEELLERYLPELRAYVQRHAGDLVRARESSSDLAQSVCREALERLADGRFEYRGEPAFREWLYRAAVMKLLKRHRHWRADKRDPAREVAMPRARSDETSTAHGLEAVGDDPTPSQEVMRSEELELFRRSFEALSERHQDVIRLHHAEGRSHAEIGAELGISEANSRMLLSRALGRLARLAER